MHPRATRHGAAIAAIAAVAAIVIAAVATPASATNGDWSLVLPPANSGPGVYDPVRDRLVIVGLGYVDPTTHVTQRSWVRSMAEPAPWSAFGEPANVAEFLEHAVYDSRRDRVLALTESGTWAMSMAGGAWTLAAPGRADEFANATFARYDSLGDRLLLATSDGNHWVAGSLSLTALALGNPQPTWSTVANGGFTGAVRRDVSIALDDVHDELLLYGGTGAGITPPSYNDLWRMPLATGTWSVVPYENAVPTGTGGIGFDARRNRILRTSSPASFGTKAFMLDTHTWSTLPGTSKSAFVDRRHDRLISFGNVYDVYVYDLLAPTDWVRFEPGPPLLSGHTAVYDAPRDRVIVFGGQTSSIPVPDTWALWLGAVPHWEHLQPAGTPPPERYRHTAVLDAANHRMIVYGGFNVNGYLNDAWALSLDDPPAWTPLTPGGAIPPGNAGHVAVYDATAQRMIVWGGVTSDAWALDLGATPSWTKLATPGTRPASRILAGAVHDDVNARTLVFGGIINPSTRTNETWSLSDAGVWTKLAPAGALPSARSGHVTALDPITRRMFVFGGEGGGTTCWELPLDSTSAWVPVGATGITPPVTTEVPGVFATSLPGLLVATIPPYRMAVPTPLAAPGPGGAAPALALAIAPQPAHDAATVRFTLPAAGKVRICVLDLAGRVIATLADGPRTAGAHELRWAPGRGVRAGVYWVRVTAGATTAARRLVLID